jgi:hypothetical protein
MSKKSYIELCFHVDGSENLYLRVPTVWDSINKQWIGFIKTPKSQTLIHGQGKTSFDLQNSFNEAVVKATQISEIVASEIFALFMPA